MNWSTHIKPMAQDKNCIFKFIDGDFLLNANILKLQGKSYIV